PGAGVDVPAWARHDGARAEPHPIVRVGLRLGTERDAARDGQLPCLVQRDDQRSRGAVRLLRPRVAEVERKADRAENADDVDQHEELGHRDSSLTQPEITSDDHSVLPHVRLAFERMGHHGECPPADGWSNGYATASSPWKRGLTAAAGGSVTNC